MTLKHVYSTLGSYFLLDASLTYESLLPFQLLFVFPEIYS